VLNRTVSRASGSAVSIGLWEAEAYDQEFQVMSGRCCQCRELPENFRVEMSIPFKRIDEGFVFLPTGRSSKNRCALA
jgi:hypothetical protein